MWYIWCCLEFESSPSVCRNAGDTTTYLFVYLLYPEGLESLKLEEMRPIFCGNLDFDARQSDVERLFKRYGKVERVDIKSGKYCF